MSSAAMSADLIFMSPLVSLITNLIGLVLNNDCVLAEDEGFILPILGNCPFFGKRVINNYDNHSLLVSQQSQARVRNYGLSSLTRFFCAAMTFIHKISMSICERKPFDKCLTSYDL
jgi:hypothetical protein